MQIGLMMRTVKQGPSGETGLMRWPDIRDIAVLAEDIGIDTLCAPDHLLFRNSPDMPMPDGVTRGTWEAFTLLTALAASTRRVTLLPFVACTSFRNPALLAKIADSLDEVSEGRLILGLGAGWHEPEYTAYGYPFDRRVSRFEEALQIILPMLKGETVTLHGQFYSVDEAVLVPRGPRAAGPPIWIGARRPRMLGLVARYADAYNTDQLLSVQDTQAAESLFQIAEEACRKVGRDPATLTRTTGASIAFDGDPALGAVPEGTLRGSADEIVAKLAAFAAIGIEHFTFWVYPSNIKAVERLAPIVEAVHKL
jgi:alkanesulfonate monooxygenase SsuD/methylene tetrahydromethanopterin reductase-like flavin-dependent oxidoreductase (luciferase family)